MNAAKQAIQRSLPHDTKYSLISTFYRSIEDGADVCQNCGKIISNIAEIKATKGARRANVAYELRNHEAYYTGDITDTLRALGSGYTRKEVLAVYNVERLAVEF